MHRFRLSFTLPVLGLCLAAGLFAGLGAESAPAAVDSVSAAKATTIVVTAGKPSELAFKLSKTSLIAPGTVIFKVKNSGRIAHTFAICLTTSANASANACTGKSKVTKLLQPGKSQTLTVTLKKGQYEFLCTFPGHASAGMKGLIGVGVKVKSVATKTTTTTATASTTTAATAPTIANNGCPAGVTIATSGSTDNDTDENGDVSDNDGCI